MIVSDADEGVFAAATAFSRDRVQRVFTAAVSEARDAPPGKLAESLGRLLYLAHLGLILWWLLDKSRDQRATRGLVALITRTLPAMAIALKVPMVRGFVASADALFEEAL